MTATDVEFLLDGLGVGSLSELRRLVERGKTVSAPAAFYPNGTCQHGARPLECSECIGAPEESCPDCTTVWPDGFPACPVCGLTIEAIAERLAR